MIFLQDRVCTMQQGYLATAPENRHGLENLSGAWLRHTNTYNHVSATPVSGLSEACSTLLHCMRVAQKKIENDFRI